MLVHGANEIGGNIDGVLGESLAVLLEARSRKVGRLCLIRVKQELDTMNGWIAPVNLTTPMKL